MRGFNVKLYCANYILGLSIYERKLWSEATYNSFFLRIHEIRIWRSCVSCFIRFCWSLWICVEIWKVPSVVALGCILPHLLQSDTCWYIGKPSSRWPVSSFLRPGYIPYPHHHRVHYLIHCKCFPGKCKIGTLSWIFPPPHFVVDNQVEFYTLLQCWYSSIFLNNSCLFYWIFFYCN